MTQPSQTVLLDQVLAQFWETVPPLWHRVRSHIALAARERFNLTHEQFHVLRRIHLGRTHVSELAQDKRISRPAVSRAVDVLVEKGLIVRMQDPDDRRHVNLALTEQGDAVMKSIHEVMDAWLTERLSTLDSDDLEQIMTGMNLLKRAFE